MKGGNWLTRNLGLLCLLLVTAGARAQVYELLPAESQVRILVYSAGPLAKLGHNHVISATEMQGEIQYQPDAPQASRFRLQFPVSGLIVDDPDARKATGSAFAATPDDEAVRATRANMLGPDVLDGQRFPQIRLRSESVDGALPDIDVRLSMAIHGVRLEMVVPVRVRQQGSRLYASGSFNFDQHLFGIQPLQIMFGAIAVQDELTVQYNLVAARLSSR